MTIITDEDVKIYIRNWEMNLRLDCVELRGITFLNLVYDTIDDPIAVNITENIAERLKNDILI